jgi:trehalose-phosphatase
MNQPAAGPFAAVILDMDGVITRTASVHQTAWKETFDQLLADRPGHEGEDHAPFTSADYRQYVDGKPRLDGVRDFLASRGITLPEGSSEDGPEADTVRGVGTRKNDRFRAVLERDGVETFADTLAAVRRWRRGGLGVAVVSASRNCRHVLGTAGVLDLFDTIADGRTQRELGLGGKPDLISTAMKELDVEPERAVLVEDATSGVAAGREVSCGLVIGVDRGDHPEHAAALREAGAHLVTENLAATRFRRCVPSAEEHLAALTTLRADRPVAAFLDFDGTLSEIVDDPDAATISDAMRTAVQDLAAEATVAIVSGRDRADVAARAGLEGLHFAGSHGLDIAGPEHTMAHPDAAAAVPEVDAAEERLRGELADVPGVVLERKRFSLAVHDRQVAMEHMDRVHDAVRTVAADSPHLRIRTGKRVSELLPDLDWDKGHAVDWLLDALKIDPVAHLVLYIGDDETDEDAFAALAGRGLGLHVGPGVSDTLADYRLDDPAAVQRFLGWLAG